MPVQSSKAQLPRKSICSATSRSSRKTRTGSYEQDQEDFIRVFVRVRPKLPKEQHFEDGVAVDSGRKSLMLSGTHHTSKTFTVDEVFDSRNKEETQESLFRHMGRDYVNVSCSGYNICMFAYGHTGSGKTYTMLGDRGSNKQGIIPRFLEDLFDEHEKNEGPEVDRRYTCEFFEVYNEHIKDLLVPLKSGDRTRRVHVHPKHGVSVENLTNSVVTDADGALELLEFGNQMRAVATTTMNARSSRSHAIFTFKFEQTDAGKSCQSTVTFVDLAGREDQAASQNQAQTFREMCCINTSLFHLANVITKLCHGAIDRKSLLDFRNSKLTLLLSPALIGNSKTALIATVAPLKSLFDDSLSTLNFAASVKKIKTIPIVNNKNPNAVIAELEKEIRQLQSDLSVSNTREAEKEQALSDAEALISKYKQSWEDAVCKSEVYNRRRTCSLSMMGLPDIQELRNSPKHETTPFLTKLSNDPSLQGRCNYMLNRESFCIGSDEDTCTLALQGLGILPQMCELVCQDGVVEITLCGEGVDPPPRVLVDGYPLLPSNGTKCLNHGSCVFLGYSHAFRLVVPKLESLQVTGAADLCIMARETVEKLDMASAVYEIVDESGEQFKEILPYVNNLSSRASDSTVQDFLSAIHRICPLIDEANMITREIFGNEGLEFQLHALTNVFNFASDRPDFVVCLLQPSQGSAKFKRGVQTVLRNLHQKRNQVEDTAKESALGESESSFLLGKAHHPFAHELGLGDHMCIDKSPLVYVWSLEKFLRRLNAIRDIYHDGCEAKDGFESLRTRLVRRPFMSPWREVALDEGMVLSKSNSMDSTMMEKSHSMDRSSEDMCDFPMSLQTSQIAASDNTANFTKPRTPLKSSAGGSRRASLQSNNNTRSGKYPDSVVSISSSLNSQHISASESPLNASVNELIEGALEQQRGWNKTLGEKMESMSSDIAHLKGALILPRQTSTMQQVPKEPKETKDTKQWQDPRYSQQEVLAHANRAMIHARVPERESMGKVLDQVSAMVAKIAKEDGKKKEELKGVDKSNHESLSFTPLVASRQSSQELLGLTDHRSARFSARGNSPGRMVSSEIRETSPPVSRMVSSSSMSNRRLVHTPPEPGLNMGFSEIQSKMPVTRMLSPRGGSFPSLRTPLSPEARLCSAGIGACTPCVNPPRNSQPVSAGPAAEPLLSNLNSVVRSPRLSRPSSRPNLETAQIPINPNVARQSSFQFKNSVALPSGMSSPRPPMVASPSNVRHGSKSPTTYTSGSASPRHSLGPASSTPVDVGKSSKQSQRRFVGIPTLTWTYYEVPEYD